MATTCTPSLLDSPLQVACTPPCSANGIRGPPTAPSPNTDIKRLVVLIDTLQVQQAHAEEQRLAAERAAETAQRDASALKAMLHDALLRLADLDDREDAARTALDGRLLEKAQHDEQLRLLRSRLATLQDEPSASSGDIVAIEERHEQQLRLKQQLAAELQQRLRQAGVDDSTLQQLCCAAEAHSEVAGGPQQRAAQQQQQSRAAHLKEGWLGGGRGGGILNSFRRQTTGA